MHSAGMSALATHVGLLDGFHSIAFALSLCLTLMVTVDTWNVKQAHSKQQEVILLLVDRWSSPQSTLARSRKALSYTPMDALSGTALGIVVTMLIV